MNSLRQVTIFCGFLLLLPYTVVAQSCTPPVAIETALQEDLISVSWPNLLNTIDYDIRIRLQGTEDWEVGLGFENGFTYLGLMSCSTYEFQIQPNCLDGSEADWSGLFEVTTAGCISCEDGIQNGDETGIDCGGANCIPCGAESCVPPVTPQVSLEENAIFLSWETPANVIDFELRTRKAGSEDWLYGANLSNEVNLRGLLSCSDYEFQIKSNCSASVSAWGDLFTVSTLGCPPCELPDSLVIAADGQSATVSWVAADAQDLFNIRLRETGTAEWIYGYHYPAGFELFDLPACTSYEFQLQTICSALSSEWSESYVLISDGCISCEDGIQNGDEIGIDCGGASCPACPVCDPPVVQFWEVSDQGLAIHLEDSSGVDSFEIDVFQDSQLVFSDKWGGNTIISPLSALDSCLEYAFRVRSLCSFDVSSWSELAYFTIATCHPTAVTSSKIIPTQIYPNPFHNRLSILIDDTQTKQYTLFSTTGMVLQTGPLQSGVNHLDLSRFGQQVMLLQLTGEQTAQTFKIIKTGR